ncbi:MAG: hypothetical protein PVG30_05415 [Gammaproteobacteria bacterium]|jgi:hypothetical protein
MGKMEKIKKFSQLIKFLNDMLITNQENELSEDIPPTIIYLLKWHSKNFPVNQKETAEKITKLLESIDSSKYNNLLEKTRKSLHR